MFGLITNQPLVSHSPWIHQQLGDPNYQVMSVAAQDLLQFMHDRKFAGINVTVPYKQAVMAYLDQLDPTAIAVQAVNTIVNDHGQLIGYNTDVTGFEQLLTHYQVELGQKTVVILGSGGSSHAVQYVAKAHQANYVVVSRTPIGNQLNYHQLRELPQIDVLINTTPVGMGEQQESPLDLTLIARPKVVIDLIYHPRRTELLKQAAQLGCQPINGLWMLVAQAVAARSYFDHQPPQWEKLATIYHQLQLHVTNLVLIGMPSAGKSTLGQLLAKQTNRQLIDVDQLLTQQLGPIDCYISDYGIEAFRKQESQLLTTLTHQHGLIISCGGGVIENPVNITNLQANGIIVLIDRPLHLLTPTPDRPLSSTTAALHQLYHQRYHRYQQAADLVVTNNRDLATIVAQIWEEYYETCRR